MRGDNWKAVIVCGGREIPDSGEEAEWYIQEVCKLLQTVGATCVISGCARGGDQIGEIAARRLGLPTELHPAMWHKYGKVAGMIRNVEMLQNSHETIALPGGRGTAHMKKITLKAGKPLHTINARQLKLF